MSQLKRYTHLAPAAPQAILEAAACLRAGGLVAMPTETVYGLAGDATNDRAVAAIYAAKGRPAFNPLIAHVADAAAAAGQAVLDDFARKLAEAFWPGPLTIVAPVAPTCQVSLLARAGLETLALRAPDHPVAQALIAAAGVPRRRPTAPAASVRRPPPMSPPISTAGSTGSSTAARRAAASNQRSSPASADGRGCCGPAR